jgi:hypothetical protein
MIDHNRGTERITGRLTIWRAAAQSAAHGAVLRALFGWLFGLFDWVNPLISGLLLTLYGAIFAAVAGDLLGLLGLLGLARYPLG